MAGCEADGQELSDDVGPALVRREEAHADGQVGLCTGPEFHRLGVFMIQSGGWLVSKDGKTATVNSKANIAAFNYVKQMIKGGTFKLTNQLGAGWGGEAFGKEQCAMTIEGNWIAGAMTHDYPTVKYKALQLPSGPVRQGHAAVRRRVGPGCRVEEQGRRDVS